MATIRLVPSILYDAVGSSYLTITNQDNMMTNTDSTTYGTVTNIYSSTSSRYVYLRGFNFSSVPSGANVESFTVKLKANESGINTATNYRPRICNNTTTLTGASSAIGTDANVITFTGIADNWSSLVGYGDNFGIRVNVRRANSGTQGYVNIYGAEIEVTYTGSVTPPTITVGTPSTGIISAESGHDQCVCTFTSDQNLQQWEARATRPGIVPGHGVGLLVESGSALNVGATGTVTIDNEELTQGDGEYTITVYGQNAGGIWSDDD